MIQATSADRGRFVVYRSHGPNPTIESGRLRSVNAAGTVFVAFPKVHIDETVVQGCDPSSLFWLDEVVAGWSGHGPESREAPEEA